MWVLGDRLQVLMLSWQAIYQVSRCPSPEWSHCDGKAVASFLRLPIQPHRVFSVVCWRRLCSLEYRTPSCHIQVLRTPLDCAGGWEEPSQETL